jgi:ATP-dependent DNA helicase PIF1
MSDIYALFGQSSQSHSNGSRTNRKRKMDPGTEKLWKRYGFDKLERQFHDAVREQKEGIRKKKAKLEEAASSTPKSASFAFDRNKYVTLLSIAPVTSDAATSKDTPIVWSEGQQQVMELVKQGKNVFFSGGAGCGKTFLLRSIIQWLQSQERVIAITAPTGLAAFLIHGVTLHGFLGLPKMAFERDADYMVSCILNRASLRTKWKELQVLLIDEISMVDTIQFGRLDYIARKVRNVFDRPFGGIQVIACGDFYQLPPPMPSSEPDQPIFAFENYSWQSTFPAQTSCVILRTTFRQKEAATVTMLNELREGIVSEHTKTILQRMIHRSNEPQKSEQRSLRLLCRRVDVDVANEAELKRAMLSATNTYTYNEEWDFHEHHVADVWKQRKAELKKRKATLAQIRRVEQELALRVPKETKRASMERDRTWRTSVKLCVNVRVRLLINLDTSNGLMNGACGTVTGFQTVQAPHKPAGTTSSYPVVRFDSGTVAVVKHYPWHSECQEGTIICWQLPFEYGYAMTIHKSQGQTLPEADIDLANVFERGQAYVAISRVPSLDRVRFTSYQPGVFDVDPRVKAFYDSIDPIVHATRILDPYMIPDLIRLMIQYWM